MLCSHSLVPSSRVQLLLFFATFLVQPIVNRLGLFSVDMQAMPQVVACLEQDCFLYAGIGSGPTSPMHTQRGKYAHITAPACSRLQMAGLQLLNACKETQR